MRYWIFIIIILLFFISIYYIYNSPILEAFNPYLDYSRAYPSTYALTQEYGPYNKSFFMYPEGYYKPFNQSVYPGNFRYNPGYGDYAYIPKHEYLKSWMGAGIGTSSEQSERFEQDGVLAMDSETYPYPQLPLEAPGGVSQIFPGINSGADPTIWPNYNYIPQDCVRPASLSSECVNQRIQEDGNLDLAIGACTVPSSIREDCWF
jgi:hypothetical protein